MNKRWIYCYLNASGTNNSVQNKIVNQIKSLKAAGMDIRGLFFTFDIITPETKVLFGDDVEFIYKGNRPNGYFRNLRAGNVGVRCLDKWLSQNKGNYDRIYIRNFTFNLRTLKLCFFYGKIMVIEFQTKIREEIRSFYHENPFGIRPSKLLGWLENQCIPLIKELLIAPLVKGRIKILVGVTKDIADCEANRTLLGKPKTLVVSNGIRVNDYVVHQMPIYSGDVLKLVMLIGASKGSNWNGEDLIIEGIRNYNGRTRIELHLVGNLNEKTAMNDAFVFRHDYLIGKQLDELVNSCHIALGAFALGRKKLKEGATLKMREYAARGIPCVFGHADADYTWLVGNKLALQLPADVVPDLKQIIIFADQICKQSGVSQAIKKYAIEKLDYNVKMKELMQGLDF